MKTARLTRRHHHRFHARWSHVELSAQRRQGHVHRVMSMMAMNIADT